MVNPFLKDQVARITRDPERKIGWDDRSVGTMRLALSQGIEPVIFAKGARLTALEIAGTPAAARAKLAELWPAPWGDEHEKLCQLMGL